MQQKIGIKFKIGAKAYSFLNEDLNLTVGDFVIVETSLGLGYGKVDNIEEYNPAKENRELKKVIRIATNEDKEQYEKMLEKERIAIQETKSLATKLKLDMNVVNAEYSLDGSKVVIDFIAEDRVDFRDLVKELATKLKSRIELRQIGIRDQAKMVGGIGICGRVCCCAAHLKDFEKVSIKMAKYQGLALNPTKISGSCGRLMCCLAYEDNYYSEVYPKMPKLNKDIKTPDGIGVVLYTNALKQIASVKITSKDGSFTVKDYSLDVLQSIEGNNSNSSIKDYKNFAQENKQIKDSENNKLLDKQDKVKSAKINNDIKQNENLNSQKSQEHKKNNNPNKKDITFNNKKNHQNNNEKAKKEVNKKQINNKENNNKNKVNVNQNSNSNFYKKQKHKNSKNNQQNNDKAKA